MLGYQWVSWKVRSHDKNMRSLSFKFWIVGWLLQTWNGGEGCLSRVRRGICCSVLATFLDANTSKTIASYLGFTSYLLFTISYINTESSVNAKVPLKKTKRLVRLAITYLVVLIAVSFGVITLLNYLAFIINDEMFAILRFSIICAMPIIIPYLLFVAFCINEPVEWIIR